MTEKKKKKKPAAPKVRREWPINPKTRVEESGKLYDRPEEKKKAKTWVDDVHWFGD